MRLVLPVFGQAYSMLLAQHIPIQKEEEKENIHKYSFISFVSTPLISLLHLPAFLKHLTVGGWKSHALQPGVAKHN